MSPREYFRTPSTMGIASELRLDHSGRSRREWLLHDRVVSEVKSWAERSAVAEGDSSRYVSSGWRRTADATAPQRVSRLPS